MLSTKERILKVLKQAQPKDLSIREISKRANVTQWTTSLYLQVLEAEKKVRLERNIGKAKMYVYVRG